MIRLSVNAKKEWNRGADQILGDGRSGIKIERDNHKEIENFQNQKKDEEIKVVDYSQFEASTKSDKDEWEVLKEIAQKFPDLGNGNMILLDENYVPFGKKNYMDSNYQALNQQGEPF